MNSNIDLVKVLSDSSFRVIIFPVIIITLTLMFKILSKIDPPISSTPATSKFDWNKFLNGEEFNWEDVAVGFDLSIGSIFLLFTEAIDIARNSNTNSPPDMNKILTLIGFAFLFAFLPIIPAILVRKIGWNTTITPNKLNFWGAILPIFCGAILVYVAYLLIK